MRRLGFFILALALSLFMYNFCSAAEHGGKEHGGKEHAGTMAKEPQSEDIRKAIADYISEKSKETGTLDILDEKTGQTRKLKFVRVHERVGKTGENYYSCADFIDTQTDETIDVDLDVKHADGTLRVVDVRIHKVDGKERYTYDDKDNRIPVKE